jgi:hypothetical protein
MTGNENFDQTLETWLRRQAPQQAPDRVLDAALERVEREPQRRGWLQRVFEGTLMTNMTRVAMVTTAVVIAAVVGLQLINQTFDIGPSPIPSPSAQPTESAAPSSAAESVEPSTKPTAAALALQLSGGGELGPYHLVTILDDGRVITSDPSAETAPLERRLTPNGIQLVRDEMAATGLTETTANFSPVANPGVEPPGLIGDLGQLEIGQPGGSTVVITWNLYADVEADYFQPQPEAEALQALRVRLTTLEEWLPAAAWADPNPVPYVPDGYRIAISSFAWGGSLDDLPPEVATLVWPVDVDRADLDDVLDSSREETRCRLIDAAEGTAVLAALEAAGATSPDGTYLAFELGERAAPRTITISLTPILPFDDSVC